MDDGPWLCYKLTNEPKNMPGSGYSLKKIGSVGRKLILFYFFFLTKFIDLLRSVQNKKKLQ